MRAIEDGMLTLRMDGWLKVLKGITDDRAGRPRDQRVTRAPLSA